VSTAIPTARLIDVAELNPPLAALLRDGEEVAFLPMSAVEAESVSAVDRETRSYSDVSKGYTRFLDGDVLVAKITPCFENGKIAHARLTRRYGFGSTEFHVVRPRAGRSDARYLVHFLRQDSIRRQGESRMTGSAGQRRVPEHFLAGLNVPVPSLPEQRRIAEILDKADTLRAKRRAALAQLDTLTQSIFLDMFGDPVTNPKGWPTESLAAACRSYSGGTPSKAISSFWIGELPWFTPKDLKQDDLFDSQDHISPSVISSSSLKVLPKDTVAIVVRGMILAHSFPVAVLRVPSTINQDLKALLPDEGLEPQFLAHSIRAQREIALQYVSEAGHGTKRLDAQGLAKLRIARVSIDVQREFVAKVAVAQRLRTECRRSLVQMDSLFTSLQHRAFRGEL
jgi:type I restriction enzyme, S subunit